MRTIIREGFAGILFRKGRFIKKLTPGMHRYAYISLGERLEQYDVRITTTNAFGSGITSDGVSVSATVPVSYQIDDLKLYATTISDPESALRNAGANAVGVAIANKDLESLEKSADAFIAAFKEAYVEGLKVYGVVVIDVFAPILTIPKNIRHATEAQVAAKKKAQADLEEARGRTAILRHYANTADLIKDKPEIMQLMLGQKAKNIHVDFSGSSAKK
jgi:regulator of protease activity HflC (stomatin/prohibitin superfamily)